MTAVFKKSIGGEEYVFYRTLLVDDVVYFAMSGFGEVRNVVKLFKDISGNWNIENHSGVHVNGSAIDFIEAVIQNEKKFLF